MDDSVQKDNDANDSSLIYFVVAEAVMKLLLWFLMTCLNRDWKRLEEELQYKLIEESNDEGTQF